MTLCHAAPTGPFTGQSRAGGAAVGGPSGREGEAQENGCAFLSNGPNLPLLRIAPLHPASCLHPNFHCPLLSWPQARPALPRGLGTDHPAPPFPGLGDSSPQTHTNLSDHPHPPPGFEPSPFSPPGPTLPSHPWPCSSFSPLDLLSLLTPGPALPSHPLDLLSLLTSWTCSPWRLGPPPREDVAWSGPLVPGVWGTSRGPPRPSLYFSAWEHPALLHPYIFAPPKPSPDPDRSQRPGGGPECCDGYS